MVIVIIIRIQSNTLANLYKNYIYDMLTIVNVQNNKLHIMCDVKEIKITIGMTKIEFYKKKKRDPIFK